MFGNSCRDCVALFAEMHSAIMKANAITENAKALAHNSHRNGQTERGEEPIIDR